MTSSIVNRRDSAKSNGGDSVAAVEVLSVVVQISFAILLSRNYRKNTINTLYYEFSLLHIFSLVLQPWMSAYIRKTDGVYISVPKND
jgi:hypothetical protein